MQALYTIEHNGKDRLKVDSAPQSQPGFGHEPADFAPSRSRPQLPSAESAAPGPQCEHLWCHPLHRIRDSGL